MRTKPYKQHELTIDVSPHARRNIITNTTFFSMDVATGKKRINFIQGDRRLNLTDATVMLGFEFVDAGTSKIIDSKDGSVVIENASRGQCSVILPNHLYQYSGKVLIHAYIMLEDGRSFDAGVIVTEFEESWLDGELKEMADFYVKRFEDLAHEIRIKAEKIQTGLEEKLEKTRIEIEAFKLKKKELVKTFVTDVKTGVKEEMLAHRVELEELADQLRTDFEEKKLELVNQLSEKKSELKSAFVEVTQKIEIEFRLELERMIDEGQAFEADIKEMGQAFKEKLDDLAQMVEKFEETTLSLQEQITALGDFDFVTKNVFDQHTHTIDQVITLQSQLNDRILRSTEIPENANLNESTWRMEGRYHVRFNATAATLTNRPPGMNAAFSMSVYHHSANHVEGCHQVIRQFDNNRIFIRSMTNNNTWTSWREVARHQSTGGSRTGRAIIDGVGIEWGFIGVPTGANQVVQARIEYNLTYRHTPSIIGWATTSAPQLFSVGTGTMEIGAAVISVHRTTGSGNVNVQWMTTGVVNPDANI